MSANESRTIADVFNLLDRWRHLPAYRLEPRVAPFFALFLRDVPERPLRRRTARRRYSGVSVANWDVASQGKAPSEPIGRKTPILAKLVIQRRLCRFSPKTATRKIAIMVFLVELKTDRWTLFGRANRKNIFSLRTTCWA